MTEKDYEIQNLRRENALLKKSRDLFKEQFYAEARKNEKLKKECDAAIADLKKCGMTNDDCNYCMNIGSAVCDDCDFYGSKWEWRGVQNDGKAAYGHTCELH